MIYGASDIVWDGKFDKPTETRWMVTWGAAAVPEGRWDRVLWFASDWAPSKLLGNPFVYYWFKPYVMLSNPLIRVHCKFATAHGERVPFWAHQWLRGAGGYLIERDGTAAPLRLNIVFFFALSVTAVVFVLPNMACERVCMGRFC